MPGRKVGMGSLVLAPTLAWRVYRDV